MIVQLTTLPFFPRRTAPTARPRYGDSDDQARGGRKPETQLTTNQVQLPLNSGLSEPAGKLRLNPGPQSPILFFFFQFY